MLILLKATKLVGTSASTFDFFLQEFRAAVLGRPRSSMHWVLHNDINNLHLYESVAVLGPAS